MDGLEARSRAVVTRELQPLFETETTRPPARMVVEVAIVDAEVRLRSRI